MKISVKNRQSPRYIIPPANPGTPEREGCSAGPGPAFPVGTDVTLKARNRPDIFSCTHLEKARHFSFIGREMVGFIACGLSPHVPVIC
jgi:hypothetical protein